MTPWHYRWLCQFAYINPPYPARPGQTLSELAQELLALDEKGELACGRLSPADREALKVILDTKELSRLTLEDFVNRNDSTGLAVYIFRAEDDSVHMIFRGSETRGCGVPTGIDWLDNFLAPFIGSAQYPEIERLARRYPEERICFSGHSKGAHNALYALASALSPRAQAIAFNGQGFPPGMFLKSQRQRLRSKGLNYVVWGDIVGVLLQHPEKRIFVKKQGNGNAHALSSLRFDRQGQPVACRRPLWTAAVEWGSMQYLKNAGKGPA